MTSDKKTRFRQYVDLDRPRFKGTKQYRGNINHKEVYICRCGEGFPNQVSYMFHKSAKCGIVLDETQYRQNVASERPSGKSMGTAKKNRGNNNHKKVYICRCGDGFPNHISYMVHKSAKCGVVLNEAQYRQYVASDRPNWLFYEHRKMRVCALMKYRRYS